jgi:hypothetical protein
MKVAQKVRYEIWYSGRFIDRGYIEWPLGKESIIKLGLKLSGSHHPCHIEVFTKDEVAGQNDDLVIYIGQDEKTKQNRVYAARKSDPSNILLSAPYIEFYGETDLTNLELIVQKDDDWYGPAGITQPPKKKSIKE